MNQKANLVFYQILGLGIFFFVLFAFLITALYSKLALILARIGNKFETICGCSDHFSFLNHPLLFISLTLTGLGVTSFLVFSIYKTVKLKRATNKFINLSTANKKPALSNKLRRVARSLGLENRIIEIKSNELLIFCYGFIKPKICISPVFAHRLNDSELRAVLLHEQHHLKVHEPIKLFLVKIISKILFFVPGITQITKKYYMHTELAADEWTIAETKDKTPLARAVYKILGWKERMVLKNSLAVPHFSNITEERINKIVNENYVINFNIFTPKIIAGLSIMLFFLISFSLFIYSSNLVIASHENSVCMPAAASEHINWSQTANYSSCSADCKHVQIEGGSCEMHHNTEPLSCGG